MTALVCGLALFVNREYERIPYGVTRQKALNAVALFSVFFVLFAVSALRMNVGSDYAKYCELFHLIRCKLDVPTVVPTEFGFNGVCILIYLLCGRQEIYPVMFAVFAFLTLFFFLRSMYRLSDWFPLTFFLFMTLGFYFQSFSTVRYYFALALALYSVRYVIGREWTKFLLLILVGAAFHKSLLVCIPLYFMAQLPWKAWGYALAAAFCATFFFFEDQYMAIFLKLYPTYEATEYLEGGTSIISIIRCAAILVFSLFFYKDHIKKDRALSFYFLCNLMALALYVCCSFLPVISRVGYYLTVTHIFFIPALLKRISDEKKRKLLTVLVMAGCLGYFAVFILYKASGVGLRILPYQTFLYHDMVTILSEVTP